MQHFYHSCNPLIYQVAECLYCFVLGFFPLISTFLLWDGMYLIHNKSGWEALGLSQLSSAWRERTRNVFDGIYKNLVSSTLHFKMELISNFIYVVNQFPQLLYAKHPSFSYSCQWALNESHFLKVIYWHSVISALATKQMFSKWEQKWQIDEQKEGGKKK